MIAPTPARTISLRMWTRHVISILVCKLATSGLNSGGVIKKLRHFQGAITFSARGWLGGQLIYWDLFIIPRHRGVHFFFFYGLRPLIQAYFPGKFFPSSNNTHEACARPGNSHKSIVIFWNITRRAERNFLIFPLYFHHARVFSFEISFIRVWSIAKCTVQIFWPLLCNGTFFNQGLRGLLSTEIAERVSTTFSCEKRVFFPASMFFC